MSLLLSRAELIDLTDRKTARGVCAWLDQRGWVYETGATGWPKVGSDYARMRLGGAAAVPTTDTEPNWGALKAA